MKILLDFLQPIIIICLILYSIIYLTKLSNNKLEQNKILQKLDKNSSSSYLKNNTSQINITNKIITKEIYDSEDESSYDK